MTKHTIILLGSLFLCVAQGQTLKDLKFGPQKESTGKTLDNIVAVVGKEVITREEIKRAKDKPEVALQQLIMRKLLLQEAKKFNITVGDTALNMAIADIAAQQKTTPDRLRKRFNANGYASYRQSVREELIINKLRQQVVSSLINISNAEVNDLLEKQLKTISDQVRLIDILISVPQSSDPSVLNQAQSKTNRILKSLNTSTPQQIAAQYDDVTYNDLGWVELSKIPSTFSKVLVDTPVNQYTKPIIDRDGIHILKVIEKSQTSQIQQSAQETHASHILIKDSPSAEQTIAKIYQQLQSGANFAQLAQTYSQDTGSAARGGDLGWVLPGQMVSEFEQTMNQSVIGKISQPFKSQFGYHILTVHARRNAVKNNRRALERQAKQAIFQRKAGETWNLWLARLRDESYVDIRTSVQ